MIQRFFTSYTRRKHLTAKTYDAFVAQGANLSDEDKQKYREYPKELSMSTLQFGQHV
jgi:peptidyl-dipeptidase Dcp